MNSLNIISANLGIGGKSKQRSRSVGDVIRHNSERPPQPKRSVSQHPKATEVAAAEDEEVDINEKKEDATIKLEYDEDDIVSSDVTLGPDAPEYDERAPLLSEKGAAAEFPVRLELTSTTSTSLLRRILAAIRESIRWVLSKLLAPGIYLLSGFREDDGRYSPLAPLRRRPAPSAKLPRNGRGSTAHAIGLSASSEQGYQKLKASSKSKRGSYGAFPTRESDRNSQVPEDGTSEDAGSPTRRSIRIKMSADEASTRRQRENQQQQRKRRSQHQQRTASDVAKSGEATQEELAAAELKSPTSPASSLGMTKYPHAPRPPRPLIPRRQPSYVTSKKSSHQLYASRSRGLAQKTLVLDLDETLIHSLSKGGRMSSGHMVEVRLAHMVAGPQHPILYYVHKRPHCDDFLRKISQWYNLVVFTASVQEYADPVIDWLEQERKFFSARFYRQHCTFRNGAYVKDLSAIEPDLSRVMILDNSPLSYAFHEANAIPIEGWINDPTDNDLLHLIPLLEGLQYVTDVRALLALRQGEVEAMRSM